MSETLRLALLVGGFSFISLLATVGAIALANFWAAKRARRQFKLLANELHAVVHEPSPTWGPRLYKIEGEYAGQPVVIETRLGPVAGVPIGGGVNTLSRAIYTHVRRGEIEKVFNWYMTTNRKRNRARKIALGL